MKWSDIPQFTRMGNWECDFSIVSFVKFIEDAERDENLQMNPDFQRGHVWSEVQQIAYVEYLLKGGKTARVIYLNNTGWSRSSSDGSDAYVCVDGLQRATAITRFVKNEIKVFGLLFIQFEGNPRITQGVKVNVNDLKTRKEVLQWYIEFNTGGTVHTEEEINRVKMLLEQEE